MRVLITGAGGFVGRHLLHFLAENQPEAHLHGTVFSQEEEETMPALAARYHRVNLLEEESVRSLLEIVQPDHIYHLAGQASPGRALNAVWRTLEMNTRIQLNLLEICRAMGLTPRIVTITSGEIYTGLATPDMMPLHEDAPLRPSNPYALSKAAQDLMALQYFLSYGIPTIRVRAFNHTGPGQREAFVAPDFAMQIARIEAGLQEPIMHVGNLAAERDFTDVRDIVRAYYLLMQQGKAGEAYNVASNKAYSIEYLLNTLLSFTDTVIDVRIDPQKMRPVDVPLVQGDYSRLHQLTGWQPTIDFDNTLRDLLDDCRQRVAADNEGVTNDGE